MDHWALRRIIPAACSAVNVIDRATANRDPEAGGTPASRLRGDLCILRDSLHDAAARVTDEHRRDTWTEDDVREYAIAAIDTGKLVLWDILAHCAQVARDRLSSAVSAYVQGGSGPPV